MAGLPAMEAAAAKPAPYLVTPDSLCVSLADCWRSIAGQWRYRTGDDPAWASPQLDDESWQTLRSKRSGVWPGSMPVSSVSWLRLHLQVAPQLSGRGLALSIKHVGAAQVYLDGALIDSVGDFEGAKRGAQTPIDFHLRDDPLRIVLSSERTSVLAIRLAARPLAFERGRALPGWVGVSIADYVHAKRTWRAANRYALVLNYLFIGAALAFAVLHLLIFAFYRERAENLYYALSVASVGGIALTTVWFSTATTLAEFRVATSLFGVAVTVGSVLLLRFYYSVFEPRLPRRFWIFCGTGTLIVLGAWWVPRVVCYVFAGLSLAEQARILLVELRRRTDGVWIMALGGGGWVVGAGWQMSGDLGLVPPLAFAYLYGFLALFASISVYLARGIGRDKHELGQQVVQIQRLSAEALQQERRAGEEALARKALEAENARHALQLDEARKREIVLQDLERANRSLREAQSRLVQSEKMAALGKLVAGVAHEINTPVGAMHSIQGTLGLAAQVLNDHITASGEPPRRVQRALSILQESGGLLRSGTERVTAIVRRLKSFARLDEAERKTADIQEGLDDSLALMQHELERGVELERRYANVPQIPCYPGRLNQAFLNLLVNAAYAVQGKGRIVVSTASTDEHVTVEITDNGVGIAPEALHKIFDPGFTTKGVGVGTGLGLAIAYQVVCDHGGQIEAESELGRGTTMRIRLPRNPPNSATEEG